jgi:hypothetical protein
MGRYNFPGTLMLQLLTGEGPRPATLFTVFLSEDCRFVAFHANREVLIDPASLTPKKEPLVLLG